MCRDVFDWIFFFKQYFPEKTFNYNSVTYSYEFLKVCTRYTGTARPPPIHSSIRPWIEARRGTRRIVADIVLLFCLRTALSRSHLNTIYYRSDDDLNATVRPEDLMAINSLFFCFFLYNTSCVFLGFSPLSYDLVRDWKIILVSFVRCKYAQLKNGPSSNVIGARRPV